MPYFVTQVSFIKIDVKNTNLCARLVLNTEVFLFYTINLKAIEETPWGAYSWPKWNNQTVWVAFSWCKGTTNLENHVSHDEEIWLAFVVSSHGLLYLSQNHFDFKAKHVYIFDPYPSDALKEFASSVRAKVIEKSVSDFTMEDIEWTEWASTLTSSASVSALHHNYLFLFLTNYIIIPHRHRKYFILYNRLVLRHVFGNVTFRWLDPVEWLFRLRCQFVDFRSFCCQPFFQPF